MRCDEEGVEDMVSSVRVGFVDGGIGEMETEVERVNGGMNEGGVRTMGRRGWWGWVEGMVSSVRVCFEDGRVGEMETEVGGSEWRGE